ncbi:MAG: glycosyltransferase [candidate division KSB1 bacterium]|nr:glycosyltransferase [candidate division KSB1 bacterium]
MIALVLALLYMCFGLFMFGSIRKIRYPLSVLPSVSVIVACKNEAKTLQTSLNSLTKLDYPSDKLEIIMVDDGSQDNSFDIIQAFVCKNNKISCLRLDPLEKTKSGKAGAIMKGIEKSSGEFIFITDADCSVPPTWIKGLLSAFDAQTGIAGGFTLAPPRLAVFQKMQNIDLLYLLSVASSTSALDKPTSWVGNNIAVRREAYDSIGGYAALDDSLVEDFALIAALDKQTRWKSCFCPSPQTAVQSRPPQTLRDWYNQRKRWACGIPQMRPLGLMIMILSFLAHLGVLVSVFKSPFSLFLLCIFIMICIDYALIYKTSRYLQYSFNLIHFVFFQFYYFAYSSLLPFFLFFDRTVVWKGLTYRTRNKRQVRV